MGFLGVIFLIFLITSVLMKNSLKVLNFTHKPNGFKVGTGKKSALIIYQLLKHNTATLLIKLIEDYLAENDYTVTINYRFTHFY